MKKIFFILSAFVLIFRVETAIAVDLSAYNYLRNVETVSSEDEIRIAVNFSKSIANMKGPRFFEKSIQFTFDDAYVKPAKKILKTGETILPNINVYQYDKNSVRLRMVIGKKDIQFENILKYEKKDNKLIITVPKMSMDFANNPYDEKSSLLDMAIKERSNKPVELFSENKELDKLTLANLNNADEQKEALQIGDTENDIASDIAIPTLSSSSLRAVAALFIVISLMLIIFYFAKKYLLGEGALLGMDKQIKVLSTSYIAPRKSIYLVEVAGEVLVLGVTATNITQLTKIENKEAIEKIKRSNEKSFIKPSLPSIPWFNKEKEKRMSSVFSKQLDVYSTKASEETAKGDNSVKALNSLIQEKIKNLKIA